MDGNFAFWEFLGVFVLRLGCDGILTLDEVYEVSSVLGNRN